MSAAGGSSWIYYFVCAGCRQKMRKLHGALFVPVFSAHPLQRGGGDVLSTYCSFIYGCSSFRQIGQTFAPEEEEEEPYVVLLFIPF